MADGGRWNPEQAQRWREPKEEEEWICWLPFVQIYFFCYFSGNQTETRGAQRTMPTANILGITELPCLPPATCQANVISHADDILDRWPARAVLYLLSSAKMMEEDILRILLWGL